MKVNLNRQRNRGFTLLELVVVVVVLGVVALIYVASTSGQGAAKSRATSMISFADKGASIIQGAIVQVGLPFTVLGTASTSNMIANGNTFLDVLIAGNNPVGLVKAGFAGRYAQTGAGRLDKSVSIDTQPAVGTPGVYRVNNYPVTLTNVDTCGGAVVPRSASWNYTLVPLDVLTSMIAALENPNLDIDAFNPAVADTTGTLRHTAANADGLHTVCVVRSIA
jgi:prepilin-type N-terminal cleavage/methylation domain-containing protein